MKRAEDILGLRELPDEAVFKLTFYEDMCYMTCQAPGIRVESWQFGNSIAGNIFLRA